MPSTCQPSPADFVAMYEAIAQPGDTIISVHLSSKMSGTYQSAVLASTMLDEDIQVKVVDSKSASMGLGLVAVTAARGVQAGKDLDEILADVQQTVDHLQVYFVVDTLEYLKKNGRIGLASALVGTMLNIKPILTLVDGEVAPFEKIRGKAKALKRVRELVDQFKEKFPDQGIRAALSHADSKEEAAQLSEALAKMLPIEGEVLIGNWSDHRRPHRPRRCRPLLVRCLKRPALAKRQPLSYRNLQDKGFYRTGVVRWFRVCWMLR